MSKQKTAKIFLFSPPLCLSVIHIHTKTNKQQQQTTTKKKSKKNIELILWDIGSPLKYG